MAIRTLYAIDSEALTVLYSTTQSVGAAVINNSDSPNGTQYAFNSGFSTRQISIDDTGGSADTLEDDNHTAHIVTDGAGLVANGTGVEAESVIQLQALSATGVPTGQIINIFVLSQNGITGDVWGFASDTPLVPGTNYQKVGGGNIGSTNYANYSTSWLVTVDGTAGNDVMGVGYTDADGDQIDGSDGTNEVIHGYGGDDTITAGAGNDTLVGGIGADALDGGAGIDASDYSTSGAGVTVNLATGTGTGGDAQGDSLSNIENVTGSAHNDSLTGDGNANVLSGGGGNDTLSGGAGDDTLVGGAGADSLDGGTGTDMADYSASGAGVSVNLTTGTGTGGDAQGDTLAGIENLTGSDFNDTLTGDGNANVLSGGLGNDNLVGGAGADTLQGGVGNDTLEGGSGADALDGGSGIDRADYSASTAAVTVNLATGTGTGGDAQGDTLSTIENITGSAHNDSLTGDGNANVLTGGGGADTFEGGGGNDTLIGGSGADSLAGGSGIDVADYSASTAAVTVNLFTGSGTGGDAQGDTLTGVENLTGSAHNDSLTGDHNENLLSGGGGNDTLSGGAGDDTLVGGTGADSLDGGTGTDMADYSASGAGVTVNLATGTGTGGDAQGDTLTGIENVTGSSSNDTLTGDGNANVLSGGLGNDSLSGGSGNDTLQGGAGNDTLEGGIGADALDGGTGIDVADYSASGAGVTVNLATGTGTGGDAQGDTLTGIENVTGSNSDDTLVGNGTANVLSGGGGSDSLSGGAGNDTLVGGTGNDTITGGTGNDIISTGSGDDLIILEQLGAHDTVTDFDIGDTNNDGISNDRLDVSDLRDNAGNPINIWDVIVTDDGFGNAVLNFPQGETLTLQGITPTQMTSQQMMASGIPCYAPGTMIDTPEGPRAVETLNVGDLVTTLDHGPQAIRWTRSGDQPLEDAEVDGKPVQIKAGALGHKLPAQDLIVSPQHRIFVGGAGQLQKVFASEAFAPAKSLTGAPGIRHMKGKSRITWIHFACDQHEVVTANGCLSESLLLGPMVVNGMDAAERQAVTDIFGPAPAPDAALNGPPARECLKVGAVRRQIAEHLKEKGCLVAKEIQKWDRDLALEKYEAERLAEAAPLARSSETAHRVA